LGTGKTVNRRRFLEQAFLASIGAGLVNSACSRNPASAGPVSPGFFTTTRRDGRWWFVTPAGEMFWSIGLIHIDPATLRYLESGEVWAEKYGNSGTAKAVERTASVLRPMAFRRGP
jgi:hypothetical protein